MVERTHTQACHLQGSPGEIHILEKRTISRLNTGFSLRVVHTSNLHLHGLHPSSVRASALHPNDSISGSGAWSYTASVTTAPCAIPAAHLRWSPSCHLSFFVINILSLRLCASSFLFPLFLHMKHLQHAPPPEGDPLTRLPLWEEQSTHLAAG